MAELGIRYQKEIGERAGLHEALISAILRKRVNPSPGEKQKIAKALETTVKELFDTEDDAAA